MSPALPNFNFPLSGKLTLVVAVIVFLYVVVNIYPFVDYLIDKIKTVTHT